MLSGPTGMFIREIIPVFFGHPSYIYAKEACFKLMWLHNLFSEELYHQMLAQALAHHFKSKLLLLDIPDLSLKVTKYYFIPPYFMIGHTSSACLYLVLFTYLQMQSKYGFARKESVRFMCFILTMCMFLCL